MASLGYPRLTLKKGKLHTPVPPASLSLGATSSLPVAVPITSTNTNCAQVRCWAWRTQRHSACPHGALRGHCHQDGEREGGAILAEEAEAELKNPGRQKGDGALSTSPSLEKDSSTQGLLQSQLRKARHRGCGQGPAGSDLIFRSLRQCMQEGQEGGGTNWRKTRSLHALNKTR